MTNAERELIKRVCDKKTLPFKTKDTGWIFIDCSKPFDEERVKKLEDKGIAVAKILGGYVFYLPDEYDKAGVPGEQVFSSTTFYAKKDIVYSIPVVFQTFGLEDYQVKADKIDLTDFGGVTGNMNLSAGHIVIGDGVRWKTMEGLYSYSCADRLLSKRDFTMAFEYSAFDHVKIVGNTPIVDMSQFCVYNKNLKTLDLLEANLTECMDFSYCCGFTHQLSRVKLGEVAKGALCTGAFGAEFTTIGEVKAYWDNKAEKSGIFSDAASTKGNL